MSYGDKTLIFILSHPQDCEAPDPLTTGEIDGLLVAPGKAYKLLTDYLDTGKLHRRPRSAHENWFKSNQPYYEPFWFTWVVILKHILDVMTSC